MMNSFFVLIIISVFTFTHVDTKRRHRCGRNEIWVECKGCELKCGQSEFTPCVLICNPAGCYCPAYDGFRRDIAGKCVAVSECPKISAEKHKIFLNITS
uniref:TIL domain-containing protein n=1 Tax=Wuchereria bancrofti TaxID=6293 RepID=A0AAF5RUU3_WUCBA